MTSTDRAKEIGSSLMDPVMNKAAQIVFGKCGNCLNRVRCSSRMINFRQLFRIIGEDTTYPVAPSKYAKAAAKVFKSRCGKCDQLKICLDIWAAPNGCRDTVNVVYKRLRALAEKDEAEVAGTFEGYMRSMNLSGFKLMGKAANLWWKCDKDKSYKTTALIFLERRK